jgi:hypothetical protein
MMNSHSQSLQVPPYFDPDLNNFDDDLFDIQVSKNMNGKRGFHSSDEIFDGAVEIESTASSETEVPMSILPAVQPGVTVSHFLHHYEKKMVNDVTTYR